MRHILPVLTLLLAMSFVALLVDDVRIRGERDELRAELDEARQELAATAARTRARRERTSKLPTLQARSGSARPAARERSASPRVGEPGGFRPPLASPQLEAPGEELEAEVEARVEERLEERREERRSEFRQRMEDSVSQAVDALEIDGELAPEVQGAVIESMDELMELWRTGREEGADHNAIQAEMDGIRDGLEEQMVGLLGDEIGQAFVDQLEGPLGRAERR